MLNQWFIWVNESNEGPFPIEGLVHHPSFHPDAWVRKEGWVEWKRARDVPELDPYFHDPVQTTEEVIKPILAVPTEDGALVSTMGRDPRFYLLLLLVLFTAAITLQYLFLQ